MAKKPPITYEQAASEVSYEPNTGRFIRASTGRETGTKTCYGYIQVNVAKRIVRANRLAVLLQTGEWPVGVVDHINGVRDDNRWANLRDVSHAINAQNVKSASRRNKLGALGVHQDRGKFKVVMTAYGRHHFVGRFSTLDEAKQAHAQAKQRLHAGAVMP